MTFGASDTFKAKPIAGEAISGVVLKLIRATTHGARRPDVRPSLETV